MMFRFSAVIACISAVLLLAGTAGAAPITVLDAGFQTPDVGGATFALRPPGGAWTYENLSYIGTIEGTQAGMLQNFTGNPAPSISQALSGFQAGQLTTVSFDMRSRIGFGPTTIDVFLDAVLLGSVTPAPSNTAFQPTSVSIAFVTAGSHTLRFVGNDPFNGDNSSYIDNVMVTQVPEPASAVLLGLAAMGLIRVARRRQV